MSKLTSMVPSDWHSNLPSQRKKREEQSQGGTTGRSNVPSERQGWHGPGGPQDKGKTSPGSAFQRDADDRAKGVSEVRNMYQNIIDARGFIDRGRSATQSASSDISGLNKVSARDHVYAPESPARDINKVARVTSIPRDMSPTDYTYAPESPAVSRGLLASRGAPTDDVYTKDILKSLVNTGSPADSVYRSPAEEVYMAEILGGLVDSRPQVGSPADEVYAIADDYAPWHVFSGYGPRTHPSTGEEHFHGGLDAAPAQNRIGTTIHAVMQGDVVDVRPEWGTAGNTVVTRNPVTGKETYYKHMQDITVQVGDRIGFRDPIGTLGNSGRTVGEVEGGAHLDIEIRDKHGQTVDPLPYLKATIPIVGYEDYFGDDPYSPY